MNVLILTPDRVGSTLLQRVLTIYMLRQEFEKPVINLHELTNGLVKYYNEVLNQNILGKPRGTEWGYFQTLPEVISLLKSVDHYKTSRLAHYHILNRKDSIADQIEFYEFLNENFFIISCRRENLLEYALSWVIKGHSKKLNVYSAHEKVSAFSELYNRGIEASQIALVSYLNKYKEYLQWVDQYFHVQSYYEYDRDGSNIEQYILNLDFMESTKENSWKQMFGQSFKEYNVCHQLLSNLQLVAEPRNRNTLMSIDDRLLLKTQYNEIRGDNWPMLDDEVIKVSTLPVAIQTEIADKLNIRSTQIKVSEHEARFLNQHLETYIDTTSQTNKLVTDGFLVTPIPIKLQTLSEKRQLIRNFDKCVVWYNQWVEETGIGTKYSELELNRLANIEERRLWAPITGALPGKDL